MSHSDAVSADATAAGTNRLKALRQPARAGDRRTSPKLAH